jgi:3-oxoacyl-[acyl-carrier protein] reductase
MPRFTGKTALVTGAAQGIGAATAVRLAAEGATVAVVCRTQERGKATVEQIRHQGGQAFPVACDVSDRDEVEAAVAGVTDAHGPIHVLVNNAGITRDGMFFKMTDEAWSDVLHTNLTSVFLVTRAVQRGMAAARYGKIVNLSSRSALGRVGQSNYAATKAGVQGLTATLALELGPYNINVNAVAPGYIATEMTAKTALRVGVTPEEHQREAAGNTPLRRVGRPEDVASVVAFLASDDAGYVSGQTLYVNGGAR